MGGFDRESAAGGGRAKNGEEESGPVTQTYDRGGRKGVVLGADGTGFVYYPNGNVAVCISEASEYQKRYYVYDERTNLMCALDERLQGFACVAQEEERGKRLVLTAQGGLLSAADGAIVHDWRWSSSALSLAAAGQTNEGPPAEIILKLNKSVTLHFTSRTNVHLAFQCENVKHTVDMSLRMRRTDSYLEHSTALPGGKLVPQTEHVTLVNRVNQLGETMRAKRNKLHPRSDQLSPMVRPIVAALEEDFKGIDEQLHAVASLDPVWKQDALSQTQREIPPIDLGEDPDGAIAERLSRTAPLLAAAAISNTSNNSTQDGQQLRSTAGGAGGVGDDGAEPRYAPRSALMYPSGKWKGDVEVHQTLVEENPILPRSNVLCAASGRYSADLTVPGGVLTPLNPTGKMLPTGRRLRSVNLDEILAIGHALRFGSDSTSAAPSSSVGAGTGDRLTVVLCVRGGDELICNAAERITEVANAMVCNAGCRIDAAELASHSEAKSGETAPDEDGDDDDERPQRKPAALRPAVDVDPALLADMDMCKLDLAESPDAAELLQIRSFPIFLFFHRGRMIYAGALGGGVGGARSASASGGSASSSSGSSTRSSAGSSAGSSLNGPVRVLLVEPNVKHQIAVEKSLRMQHCEWDLCLDASQALDRRTDASRLAASAGGGQRAAAAASSYYDMVMLSEDLSDSDIAKTVQAFGSGPTAPLMCALVSLMGDMGGARRRFATWKDGVTTDVEQCCPTSLSAMCPCAVAKPMSGRCIRRLLRIKRSINRARGGGGGAGAAGGSGRNGGMDPLASSAAVGGLTPTLLVQIMAWHLEQSRAGGARAAVGMSTSTASGSPTVGVALATEDIRFKGNTLAAAAAAAR